MNGSDNPNGKENKTYKMIPVGYAPVENGSRRGFVPNPDYPKPSSGLSDQYLNPSFDKLPNLDNAMNLEQVNAMMTGIEKAQRADNRNEWQIENAKKFGDGKDIAELLEDKDKERRKELVSLLAYNLYLGSGIWETNKTLFIKTNQNRYIKYDERKIAEWIRDRCGLKNNRINSVMAEVSKAIRSFCKRDNRVFTDKTIREQWHIMNFTNCSYDVFSDIVLHGGVAPKIGYINACYIGKSVREGNDGGMKRFAALCSDDESEQKRLLQALAYAISDYRDSNRLFVFKSENDKPLQIIDSFMKAVLGDEQIRPVPFHNLIDNMDLSNVKLIVSKNCKKQFEFDDESKLHSVLSGTPIPFCRETKEGVLHTEIRNDLVVFYLGEPPKSFIENLPEKSRKLISSIKIQSDEAVKWSEVETQLLNNLDYAVSYLIDEVLLELYEDNFILTESDSEQEEMSTPKNPITQLKLFIKDKCDVEAGYSINKQELHEAFVAYSGIRNRNSFYTNLLELSKEQKLGIEDTRDDDGRIFKGICLKR